MGWVSVCPESYESADEPRQEDDHNRFHGLPSSPKPLRDIPSEDEEHEKTQGSGNPPPVVIFVEGIVEQVSHKSEGHEERDDGDNGAWNQRSDRRIRRKRRVDKSVRRRFGFWLLIRFMFDGHVSSMGGS